jgi:hypothetical protein
LKAVVGKQSDLGKQGDAGHSGHLTAGWQFDADGPSMTTINPASTATGAHVSNARDKTEIASNFTTFLQLLTTQLKNQNPLDPLDTNQFTQQLV